MAASGKRREHGVEKKSVFAVHNFLAGDSCAGAREQSRSNGRHREAERCSF
jgi:hypothetical protein